MKRHLDQDLERRLICELPERAAPRVPRASQIIELHQRSRRARRRCGLATVCGVLLGTSALLTRSTQPSASNQLLILSQPASTSDSPSLASRHVPPPTALTQQDMEPTWELGLGDVTEYGAVTLVLTSPSSPNPRPTVVGYVTPPQAIEVPLWQLQPAEQETIRDAWHTVNLVQTIDF